VLHAYDGSGERDAGNNDILAVDEGNNTLPMDDDSGALRANGDSDVPSGNDTIVPVIAAIGVASNFGVGDLLAAICGGAVSVTIGGCGPARGRRQRHPRRG
jgi:hypothetical protein